MDSPSNAGKPREFFQEQGEQERRDRHRFLLRAGLMFFGIIAFATIVLWSSGLALRRGAESVAGPLKPTFRVFGQVVNNKTGKPVPWVTVFDYQSGFRPPNERQGDFVGHYEVLTIPEQHDLIFACEGFYPRTIRIGQPAHLWISESQLRMDIRLEPREVKPAGEPGQH